MNSINLLPPDIKKSIEQRKKNARTVHYFWRSFMYALLALAISGAAYVGIEQLYHKNTAELAKAETEISSYGDVEAKAKSVAEKLSTIKSIQKEINSWSGVILEIQKVMPSNVSLSRVSLKSDSKTRAEITGFAKTKEGIASLRDALDESEYFEYVDIESASTEKDAKTEINLESFVITFSLSKGALDE
jgi:Tfp pilus assembly protein PilN